MAEAIGAIVELVVRVLVLVVCVPFILLWPRPDEGETYQHAVWRLEGGRLLPVHRTARVNERKPILELIRNLGYAVSVHRVNGVVEMHAVQLAYPCAQHIARVTDGDGDEESYRRACEQARMVGIDLEGG